MARVVRVGSKESMPFSLVLALYYKLNKGVRPGISTRANRMVGCWLMVGLDRVGSEESMPFPLVLVYIIHIIKV